MPCPCPCLKSLEDQLESWMQRYDKDTEDKQRELNTVKTNKSNNLAQLQELAKKVSMFFFFFLNLLHFHRAAQDELRVFISVFFFFLQYRDSEQVIIEDRSEKERLRKQLEKEQLQRKAAIKVNFSLMFWLYVFKNLDCRWEVFRLVDFHVSALDKGEESTQHTTLPQCIAFLFFRMCDKLQGLTFCRETNLNVNIIHVCLKIK